MKPVYAFDIDGVLCDTTAVLREALERELGVTLERGGAYDTFGFLHGDEAVMEYLREHAMTHWRRPTVFANGEASGQDVIRALADAGQLAGYVTRRHPDLYENTFAWLQQGDFPLESTGRLGYGERRDGRQIGMGAWNLHHMLGDVASKADAARWLGATHLVEDSGREAHMAAEDGLDVVVLRRDYNRDLETLVQAQLADLSDATPAWCRRISFIDRLEDLLKPRDYRGTALGEQGMTGTCLRPTVTINGEEV